MTESAAHLGLDPRLLRALGKKGFSELTPVQVQVIPKVCYLMHAPPATVCATVCFYSECVLVAPPPPPGGLDAVGQLCHRCWKARTSLRAPALEAARRWRTCFPRCIRC